MKKLFKPLSLVLAITLLSVMCLTACAPKETTPSASADASSSNAPVDDTVYTFKIDYPNSENSAIYPLLVDWADYISEQSDGRLVAEIYPNGQLGPMPEIVNNCVGGLTDGFWSGRNDLCRRFSRPQRFLAFQCLGANNQQVLTAAMNAMLTETDYLAPEWDILHVVALHSATASPLLFKN